MTNIINNIKKSEEAKNNKYHLFTKGEFEIIKIAEKGEKAEELMKEFDKIKSFGSMSGSMYLYDDTYLYRGADHWGYVPSIGRSIAGCKWYFSAEKNPELVKYKTHDIEDNQIPMLGETKVWILGRIKWEDLIVLPYEDRNPIFIWFRLKKSDQERLLESGIVEWTDKEKGFVKFNSDYKGVVEFFGYDPIETMNCYE